MSRVYFHEYHRTSELYGRERAYAGNLISDMALAVLRPAYRSTARDAPLVTEWLPKDHYLRKDVDNFQAFTQGFEAMWRVGWEENFTDPETGDKYESFRVSLNTGIAAGSDPIKLLTRMHGTCEIHGYMEGGDRAFIAEIIEQGRAEHILRPDMGWEDVRAHLLERDSEPVVMSYSVTDSFPSWWIMEEIGAVEIPDDQDVRDEQIESWYEQPSDVQWGMAMDALREFNKKGHVRWDENNFYDLSFGDGVSAFGLLELMYERDKAKV